MRTRCLHEAGEQWMTVTRGRAEFRVELAGDEEWMIWQLNHFDQAVGLIDITDLIGLEPAVGVCEPASMPTSLRIFGSTI